MVSLLKLLAGLVGVFWMAIAGGYAVYWYDRRPVDTPKPYVVRIFVFHASFGLPASLKARADGAQAELKADRDAAQAEAARLQLAVANLNVRAGAAEARAQRAIRAQQSTPCSRGSPCAAAFARRSLPSACWPCQRARRRSPGPTPCRLRS